VIFDLVYLLKVNPNGFLRPNLSQIVLDGAVDSLQSLPDFTEKSVVIISADRQNNIKVDLREIITLDSNLHAFGLPTPLIIRV
jgi:hypothetical protein